MGQGKIFGVWLRLGAYACEKCKNKMKDRSSLSWIMRNRVHTGGCYNLKVFSPHLTAKSFLHYGRGTVGAAGIQRGRIQLTHAPTQATTHATTHATTRAHT
jgi:hypothetical protein